MNIKLFNKYPIFACNSYLIYENDHCLLIDCGYFSNEMKNEIHKFKYFDGVIITHKHFDHIAGLTNLKQEFNDIKIYSYMNNDDFLHDGKLNASYYMLENIVTFNGKVNNILEGNNKIGIFNFNIMYTPGHSSDSLIIIFNDVIFVGDLIFHYSHGRTDLWTSSPIQMQESLLKIKKLFDMKKYYIYPGHDESFYSNDCYVINKL